MTNNESFVFTFGILVGGILVAILITLFIGLRDSTPIAKQGKLDTYNQCKERTSDVEWCFNEFRPEL